MSSHSHGGNPPRPFAELDEEKERSFQFRFLSIGEQIGVYRILARIGSGAFGTVYQVEHAYLGRKFALKQLRPTVAESSDIESRFLREARLLGLLDHPHIVQVVDCQFFPQVGWCLVMEWLLGSTLDLLLRRSQPSSRDILLLFHQLCSALDHVHHEGIIHRDLKPSNLFLTRKAHSFHLKLMDFGISSPSKNTEERLTVAGQMLGSFLYMSPEQALGQHERSDARSDIYSAGILLAELLCGKTPFQGPAPTLLFKHLTEPPPPLHLLDPSRSFPSPLEAVYQRALAKDPAQRFPSIASFWSSLFDAFSSTPSFLSSSSTLLPALEESFLALPQKDVLMRRERLGNELLSPSPSLPSLSSSSAPPSSAPPSSAPPSSAHASSAHASSAHASSPDTPRSLPRPSLSSPAFASPRPSASTPVFPSPETTPLPSSSVSSRSLFASNPPGSPLAPKPLRSSGTSLSMPSPAASSPPPPSPTPPPPSLSSATPSRSSRSPRASLASPSAPPPPPTKQDLLRLTERGFEALRQGGREQAKALWEEVLRFDPDNKTLQANLKKLHDSPKD